MASDREHLHRGNGRPIAMGHLVNPASVEYASMGNVTQGVSRGL